MLCNPNPKPNFNPAVETLYTQTSACCLPALSQSFQLQKAKIVGEGLGKGREGKRREGTCFIFSISCFCFEKQSKGRFLPKFVSFREKKCDRGFEGSMLQDLFRFFVKQRRSMQNVTNPSLALKPRLVPTSKTLKLTRFRNFLVSSNMILKNNCFIFVAQLGMALVIFQVLRNVDFWKSWELENSARLDHDEWDSNGQFLVLESFLSSSNLKLGADVEGANIDHNGSTASSCLTERPLLLRALLDKVPGPFSGIGIHSFILRSSYRVNDRHFVAIGMSALALHQSKQRNRCEWHGLDQSHIEGRQYVVWPGEHHDLMYESAIFHCELENGTLPGVGGSLFMKIDEEIFSVYKEEKGRLELEPKAPFKYNLAFCSFPIYRDVLPQRLGEWLQYAYRSVGVDYFVLHDGGPIDESVMEVLNPYVKAELMEIIDIRAQYQYESKHNVLTLNDCLYRMRWLSNWALFADFDEYLFAQPPQTVLGILKEHSEAPYLTFGSLWWSVTMCRNSDDKRLWPVEKMSFHWPDVYCVNRRVYETEECLNYYGHRKYVVNPRKVWVLEVHRPVDPIQGGVNLNTSLIRNNHFQGLLRSSLEVCSEPVKAGINPEWWVEGNDVASEARRARVAGLPSPKKKFW